MASINSAWNGKCHIKRKSDSQYKASQHCGNVRSDACHSFHVAVNIGHSPSGKAQHFDCCIRWFDSNMPCSGFTWFPDIGLSSSFHPHSGKLLRAVTRLVRGSIVYNPTIHERENQPVAKTSVIGRADIYTPSNC